MQNRHPIDRLADLRKQISELEAEANVIRASILAGAIDLHGEEYDGEIRDREQRCIPYADAQRVLPSDLLAQVTTLRRQRHVLLTCTRPPDQL